MAGGADADLIIDDTLIDIKTTKSCSFTQDMYSQLLGYYALSTMDGRFDDITEIGIYFSRYSLFTTMPAPDMKAVGEIVGWFKEYRQSRQRGI